MIKGNNHIQSLTYHKCNIYRKLIETKSLFSNLHVLVIFFFMKQNIYLHYLSFLHIEVAWPFSKDIPVPVPEEFNNVIFVTLDFRNQWVFIPI